MRVESINVFPNPTIPNTICISGYGTLSIFNFWVRLYNNQRIDSKFYVKNRNMVPSNNYAESLISQNIDLFPIEF